MAGRLRSRALATVVRLVGIYAGLFLDISQFGITFLAIVAGSVAWGLMALAVWPTLMRYDQPVWMALLLPRITVFDASVMAHAKVTPSVKEKTDLKLVILASLHLVV